MKSMKWVGTCLGAVVCLLSTAGQASADLHVGGFQGKPVGSSMGDWSYFSESWGGVFSNGLEGDTWVYWEAPLPITDNGGSYTVTAYIYQDGADGDSVECNAAGVSANESTTRNTSGYISSTTANATTLSMSVTVPTGGYLFVTCQWPYNNGGGTLWDFDYHD